MILNIQNLMTFTDVAKTLQTSRQNVSALIARHSISHGQIGVQKYITKADLELLLIRRKRKGAPKENQNARKVKNGI
jgi:hypothetical protein